MKFLKVSLLFCFAFMMASCGNGYDEQRATNVVSSYKFNKKSLSENERAEAVELYCAYLYAKGKAMENAIKTASTRAQYDRAMRKFDRDYADGAGLQKIVNSISKKLYKYQEDNIDDAENYFDRINSEVKTSLRRLPRK